MDKAAPGDHKDASGEEFLHRSPLKASLGDKLKEAARKKTESDKDKTIIEEFSDDSQDTKNSEDQESSRADDFGSPDGPGPGSRQEKDDLVDPGERAMRIVEEDVFPLPVMEEYLKDVDENSPQWNERNEKIENYTTELVQLLHDHIGEPDFDLNVFLAEFFNAKAEWRLKDYFASKAGHTAEEINSGISSGHAAEDSLAAGDSYSAEDSTMEEDGVAMDKSSEKVTDGKVERDQTNEWSDVNTFVNDEGRVIKGVPLNDKKRKFTGKVKIFENGEETIEIDGETKKISIPPRMMSAERANDFIRQEGFRPLENIKAERAAFLSQYGPQNRIYEIGSHQIKLAGYGYDPDTYRFSISVTIDDNGPARINMREFRQLIGEIPMEAGSSAEKLLELTDEELEYIEEAYLGFARDYLQRVKDFYTTENGWKEKDIPFLTEAHQKKMWSHDLPKGMRERAHIRRSMIQQAVEKIRELINQESN